MKLISSTALLAKIPAIIFMAGIFFSCVNDLDTIQKVTFNEDAPNDVMREFNMFYNDFGYARVEIYAALAETYINPTHLTKLKDGVKVDFYSDDGIIISKLTALYGEVNYESGEILVRDSVSLLNLKKGQLLETEELFWNQNDSMIYTNKNVIIKSPDNSIQGWGRGIETTQEFSHYKIIEPYGKFDLSK
jgi:LPS export ABC transporter protein LptC